MGLLFCIITLLIWLNDTFNVILRHLVTHPPHQGLSVEGAARIRDMGWEESHQEVCLKEGQIPGIVFVTKVYFRNCICQKGRFQELLEGQIPGIVFVTRVDSRNCVCQKGRFQEMCLLQGQIPRIVLVGRTGYNRKTL